MDEDAVQYNANAAGAVGAALGGSARKYAPTKYPPTACPGTISKPVTAADQVRNNAERAAARMSGLRSRISDLRERIAGPYPPSAESCDVAEQLAAGGFIAGTGDAVARIHNEITEIEDILTSLSDMI